MAFDTARPTFSEAYAAAYQGCQGPNPLASIRELQRLRAEVLKGDEKLIFLADNEACGTPVLLAAVDGKIGGGK